MRESTQESIQDSVRENTRDSVRENTQEPWPLRPHHGMCMAYFQGKGYSEKFSEHMSHMISRLETENPQVRLTIGTDCICSACPNNMEGVCSSAEKVKRFDEGLLSGCGLKNGSVLSFRDFSQMVREQILDRGLRENICGDCQWTGLCIEKYRRR